MKEDINFCYVKEERIKILRKGQFFALGCNVGSDKSLVLSKFLFALNEYSSVMLCMCGMF